LYGSLDGSASGTLRQVLGAGRLQRWLSSLARSTTAPRFQRIRGKLTQDREETLLRAALAVARRKVRAAKNGCFCGVSTTVMGQPPPRSASARGHVDVVDVRPLFTVDLDGDECWLMNAAISSSSNDSSSIT